MKKILIFEDTYPAMGVYTASVVSAVAVPESFISWGFYPTAQGHGYYEIFTNTEGEYDYLAVDYSFERAGAKGREFSYDAWHHRKTAAPWLRLYNTVTTGRAALSLS